MKSLSANKIWLISQLATRHNALVILPQKTHCTNPNQLVIPHLALADWISNRKRGFAAFVHEKCSWTQEPIAGLLET